MYTRCEEMLVLKTSLKYMIKAREYSHALHMTDHGHLHAQRVYSICSWLSVIFSLSEYESSLLQSAALLHDIGMASSDRENHNKESERLVISDAQSKKLPFLDAEATLIGKLCLWHRGDEFDQNCVEECEHQRVRVGLLACILRLSDELDLDFRRTEVNSVQEMDITEKYKNEQLKYHASVLSIIGVRIRTDRLSTHFELLIHDIEHASLQIQRLIKEILGTTLPFPVSILPTKMQYIETQGPSNRRAIIYAYCNPHGLLTAVLSKISLKLAGIDSKIVCNSSDTSNSTNFWINFDSNSLQSYESALFIDLHIDDRTISNVEEIISRNTECKVFMSGVTLSSSAYVTRLIEIGVTLFLGDEHVLFYADFITKKMLFWIMVAGLCNFDNHVTQKNTTKDIHNATRGLKFAIYEHFKDSSQHPIEQIIEKIESNDRQYFLSKSKNLYTETSSASLNNLTLGRVIIVSHHMSVPGRFIYDWITHHIMTNGCLPYQQFEFTTPYAIYFTEPKDNGSISVLFLSYFKNSNTTLPVKCFCKNDVDNIGTNNTIWKRYSSMTNAIKEISDVIASINTEYDDDFKDAPEIIQNIELFLKHSAQTQES